MREGGTRIVSLGCPVLLYVHSKFKPDMSLEYQLFNYGYKLPLYYGME